MDVDRQPTLRGDLAEFLETCGPLCHRALAMRNAADGIDTHVKRPDEVLPGVFVTIESVLWKRHDLQVDIRRNLLADRQ